MARYFQPSFYYWALKLPESDGTRLLHARAREVYADFGGEAIERSIRELEAIVTQGRSSEVTLRDFMRALAAIDRAYTRRDTLRERAWMQARVDVFQATNLRIPLPQTPEQVERGVADEEARVIRGVSEKFRALHAMGDELKASNAFAKLPTRAQLDESNRTGEPIKFEYAEGPQHEPPTNKQIKLGIQRLIAAEVDRKIVTTLRDLARSGKVTREHWNEQLHTLLTAKA